MKNRPISTRTKVLATAGIAVVAAGPVWADCCDSVFDCAATVVTEGVSCEIQTILDTIKTVQTIVDNIKNDVTGQTQAAERTARQSVTDTYNAMQSQSQQSDSDLASALTQATVLYKSETQILAALPSTVVSNRNLTAAGATQAPPAPSSPPATMAAMRGQAVGTTATAPSSPQRTMTVAGGQVLNAAPAANNPQLQKSTVDANTNIADSAVKLAAPHGAYADAFSRGVKEITTLKGTGDQDTNTVSRYLAQAQATEGPGVAAADTVAGAMMAPLTAVASLLSGMLSNPLSAFDPSSLVDNIQNTVEADLSANVQQMIDDIQTGPNQAFSAAQPTYDDLLTKAERAQAITAAMQQLYKTRTPGAANALYALLPLSAIPGLNNASQAKGTVVGQFGQRMSFALVSAKMSTAKQHALLAYKRPVANPQLRAAVAQFKAQRAQGKSGLPQSAMAAVQGTMAQQFDAYFKGKSAAAIASARDQLIAQVRAKYPKDPNTANSIIALVTNAAASRAGPMNAKLINPTVPGQPVGAPVAPTATTTTAGRQTLATPVAAAAPVNAFAPAAKTVAAPAAVAPAATTAVKAPSWGAAPAWTPATTAVHPATVQPITTLKTTQPAQQVGTSATQMTAPSSLSH